MLLCIAVIDVAGTHTRARKISNATTAGEEENDEKLERKKIWCGNEKWTNNDETNHLKFKVFDVVRLAIRTQRFSRNISDSAYFVFFFIVPRIARYGIIAAFSILYTVIIIIMPMQQMHMCARACACARVCVCVCGL